jgi:hypothetical protein
VTALMWASAKGHTVIVQALIEAGADLNLQNKVCGGFRAVGVYTSLIVRCVDGCNAFVCNLQLFRVHTRMCALLVRARHYPPTFWHGLGM